MSQDYSTDAMNSLRDLKFGFEAVREFAHDSTPVVFDPGCFEYCDEDGEQCDIFGFNEIMSLDWIQCNHLLGVTIRVCPVIKPLILVCGMIEDKFKEYGLYDVKKDDCDDITLEAVDGNLTEHQLIMALTARYDHNRRTVFLWRD